MTAWVAVADAGVLAFRLAGQDLVLWHRPGQRSALDEGTIADSRDIGTIGVFNPRLRDHTLSFTADRRGFRDDQTGNAWNVLGETIPGSLSDRRLKAITHPDTFWFAWVAFQPDTTLHPARP